MSLSLPEGASSNYADFSMLTLAVSIGSNLLKVSFFVSIELDTSNREAFTAHLELPKPRFFQCQIVLTHSGS